MKNSTTFKKRMQKLTILLAFVMPTLSFAQPGNTLHWKLGGNIGTGIDAVNATNNILGTIPNLPLLFHTNGVNRVYINQNKTPTINAFNVNTSGYIGIGNPTYGPTLGNTPFFSTKGPFSLLHLNGLDGGGQELGYRPWMQTS